MTLNYLDFDYSEDADGTGTFDAMASVPSAQVPALYAEVAALLAWAHAQFPDACGPEEDGGEWQYDLQGVQETSTPLTLEYEPGARSIHTVAGAPLAPRTTLTLSISGGPSFCAALRDRFGIE